MDTIKNRGQIILRTLAIIDVLARARLGMTRTQIADEIAQSCGKRFSENTITRDLIAMQKLAFVRREDRPRDSYPWVQTLYFVNQNRTEFLQRIAMDVIDE